MERRRARSLPARLQEVREREEAEEREQALVQRNQLLKQKEALLEELEGVQEEKKKLSMELFFSEMKTEKVEDENTQSQVEKECYQEKKTKLEEEKRQLLQTVEIKDSEVEALKIKVSEKDSCIENQKATVSQLKKSNEDVLEQLEDREKKLETLETNNKKMKVLMAALQEKVECPVCLVVPREGPVPCCPSGHITCSPCLDRLRAEGKLECPTCREPMGEGRSALAKVVIEHMDHECSFRGCGELVALKDYAAHQATCRHRLAACPAVGAPWGSSKMEAFCDVLDHARACRGICSGDNLEDGNVFGMDRFAVQELDNFWKIRMLEADSGNIFFLKVQKVNNMFSLEVVMLGTQEECEAYTMEVSVIHPDTKMVAIKASFKPRPIVATNDTDDFCLTFKQKSLAKMMKHSKEKERLDFIVSVHIQMQTL